MMIWGMLHNTTDDRWHPICFYRAPTPSHAEGEKACRYKSRGHHTKGFATREEADAFVAERIATDGDKHAHSTWEWDGTDIPAIVTWFGDVASGSRGLRAVVSPERGCEA